MVRKDENPKNLFLSVHFPAQMEASEVMEYKIKEEKSCECIPNFKIYLLP